MAENYDVRVARLIFLRGKHAPKHGRNTQRREEAAGHGAGVQLFRLVAPRHCEAVIGNDRHPVEGLVLALPVHEVCSRHRKRGHSRKALGRRNMPDADEAVGIFECKWPQKSCIYHAENYGVHANPQAQCDHRNRAKPRALAQLPQGVANVMDQTVHACTSAISFFSSSSATTLPSNRCTSRWACFANRGSCVTMQIVAPSRCRFCSSSITASPLRESRFPVGSSASRMDGFPPSARATATRCCWPPESCEG